MNKQHKASIDGDQWAQCVRDHGWLWDAASGGASATLILAHGAGAPMDSDWMTDMAGRLAALGVNVLRFEFPYMAQRRVDGVKRPPNPAPKLLECWREVFAEVRRHVAGALAIGGKSMGGRMASLLLNSSPQNLVFNETCLGNFQHFGKTFSVVKIYWFVLQQIFDGFAECSVLLSLLLQSSLRLRSLPGPGFLLRLQPVLHLIQGLVPSPSKHKPQKHPTKLLELMIL